MALTLAYGLPIQPRDDPYITLVKESLHEIVKASLPGQYLVEFIPILKHIPTWLPGAGFHETARKTRILSKRFRNEPFEAAIQHMVRYRSLSCLWDLLAVVGTRGLETSDLR